MSQSGFDSSRFKALERAGFNRIAERYAECASMRTHLADSLLYAAALEPGMSVLDLASGPALLASEAAKLIRPGGWVLASDIAERMLGEARARLNRSEPESAAVMSFVAADAEHLCLPDQRFDRVLAGLALFIFPDPEKALAEIRRVLKPGGQLLLSVWGTRDQVPLISCAQDCIARLLPPPKVGRPSVFRFGDETAMHALLTQAGFGAPSQQPCDFVCEFADAQAYWQAFLDLAGGVAEALARLPKDKHDALQRAVAEDLQAYRTASGSYRVPARAIVWRATA